MDRRFLFPAVAITAWAQQPAPAPAEAEAALRARAEQFFQLQVDKKYRQAEAMVAEDTKDTYYNGKKYSIKSFSIQSVELLDDNTRAKVTILAKVTLVAATVGAMDFDAPIASSWKIEEGQWVWYVPQVTAIETPFGIVHPGQPGEKPPSPIVKTGQAPDVSVLQSAVKIDRNSIVLTPDAPLQTVTVSNGMPGAVDLELSSDRIKGLSSELEKKHLAAGESTVVRFRGTGGENGAGVVHVLVSQTAADLEIHVNLNLN